MRREERRREERRGEERRGKEMRSWKMEKRGNHRSLEKEKEESKGSVRR